MSSAPEQPSGPIEVARRTGRALAHPLVLLLIGAAISTILVPSLTQRSQRNKEALEIRRDLAERVSSAMSPFLSASLSNFFLWRGKTPAEYDHAYERWSAQSEVILTRMRTYLGDARVPNEWQDIQYATRWLYEFFKVGATPEQSRRIILRQYLRGFLARSCRVGGACLDDYDIRTLAQFYVPPKGINPALDRSLSNLLDAYRVRTETVIEQILKSPVRL